MKGVEPRRELCTFTTYLHPLLLIQTPGLWSVYAFVLGQIGLCVCVEEKPCMQVMSSFTHTHTYTQMSTHVHMRPHTRTVRTHTDGKLNGKNVSITHRYEFKIAPRTFFFSHLVYLKRQCKCSLLSDCLLQAGKEEEEEEGEKSPNIWNIGAQVQARLC